MSKITLLSIMRNEAEILPFWLRHYSAFVDRIIVYDHNSTDATRLILISHPLVDMRDYEPEKFDDGDVAEFINYVSAGLDSDWVIVADADEFIYPAETLRDYLEYYESIGVTLPSVHGYSMIASEFPQICDSWTLTDYVKTGVADELYNKYAIFHRTARINYMPGRHSVAPTGSVVIGNNFDIKLLHYRYFGREWLAQRNARNASGLSDRARGMGWGWHVQPDHQRGRYSAEWYEAQRADRVIP